MSALPQLLRKTRYALYSTLIALSSTVTIAAPASVNTHSAILKGLDKVTGRSITIPINDREKVKFGDLYIVLKTCLDDYTTKTSKAHLQIYESLIDKQKKLPNKINVPKHTNKKIFDGWMFANLPGLIALEHPIYDVWLIKCAS